ncbi:helix-turn-helix domain-containing protein [[Clostridium] colinum]|uniref:helix-turn-helix domain-containing protein n=1 Tax=[Clostridium] colinum TaxID=36835 RepID=UPI0020258197|nr:helix-turn-helix transcriptional regulator [[Clostridium] colinum]
MYTMINNKFSVLLAERLLKISTVSRDTGISRTTLTNLYYKRTNQISIEVLDKLCSYLNCTVNDILEFKEE